MEKDVRKVHQTPCLLLAVINFLILAVVVLTPFHCILHSTNLFPHNLYKFGIFYHPTHKSNMMPISVSLCHSLILLTNSICINPFHPFTSQAFIHNFYLTLEFVPFTHCHFYHSTAILCSPATAHPLIVASLCTQTTLEASPPSKPFIHNFYTTLRSFFHPLNVISTPLSRLPSPSHRSSPYRCFVNVPIRLHCPAPTSPPKPFIHNIYLTKIVHIHSMPFPPVSLLSTVHFFLAASSCTHKLSHT